MYILIDSFRNCILASIKYLLQISIRGVDLADCFIPVLPLGLLTCQLRWEIHGQCWGKMCETILKIKECVNSSCCGAIPVKIDDITPRSLQLKVLLPILAHDSWVSGWTKIRIGMYRTRTTRTQTQDLQFYNQASNNRVGLRLVLIAHCDS